MYNLLKAEDFKKNIGLSENYKIDGLICYGTMKNKRREQEFTDVISSFGTNVVSSSAQESGFFENVKEINIGGKLIWYDTCYGGAYISELVHVASLLGSQKNILIGSCGGLDTNAKSGDIIVPIASYGNESSTRMYQPLNEEFTYFPNDTISKSLISRLEQQYRIVRGRLVTCQANLIESFEDIKRWSEEGYTGVEMESSTFFAVSNHFKVPSAAMIFISDNLINKETALHVNYENLQELFQKIRREIFKVAIQEIIS